jgi:site-specific DNA-cytosine methylase
VREALGLVGRIQAGIGASDTGERGIPRSTDEPNPAVSGASRTFFHPVLDRPAPTVTGGSTSSHVNGRSILSANAPDRVALTEAGIRSYTVAETAVIQDLPAAYPLTGSKQEQYRQAGNCVPPTLARVVCEAVRAADTIERSAAA